VNCLPLQECLGKKLVNKCMVGPIYNVFMAGFVV
jgi:hypothetical protein